VKRREYLLGIDSGVSKTAVALGDSEGCLLGQERGTGMMLLGPPTEDQLDILRLLISRVCSSVGVDSRDITHVGAGMCGVDLPRQWEEQHSALCRGLGLDPERTTLVNDAIVALWGATRAGRSTIVQQGSAFTSAYRAAVGHERLFDPFDFARLLDVRKEALARVARMLDGRAPRTSLASRLLEHVGADDAESLADLLADPFGEGWSRLSTISGVVSAAWLEGESAATEMIETLASDLAVTVRAMAEHMGPGPFEAAFGGGVLQRLAPEFLDLLGARLKGLCPESAVARVALPPEQGALVMAGFGAGLDPTSIFGALAERRSASAGDRMTVEVPPANGVGARHGGGNGR
jgi:N-acetylglucosamine kinase-like BadF-type ATPase